MSKKVEKNKEAPVEEPEKEEPTKGEELEKTFEEPDKVGEKEKPVKVEKPKAEKRHKEEKGARGLYTVEGDKVVRLRPTCERCGIGFFMADHHNRYTCGHCGFTRYKQAER